MPTRPLIAIVGPTGAGKSELALEIAAQVGGEIVNCDSLQLYRYFDIGTAKTPLAERRGILHHLLDILNPDEISTAGEYAARARAELPSIALPIVTGGTGFYLRALLDGLFPAPPRRDDALRARLDARERRHSGSLHRLLVRFDPASAKAIHPHDVPKLIRALEVFLLTGRPISGWFSKGREPLEGYEVLKIGLDPLREMLRRRLNERCQKMFSGGLIEEVEAILAMGWPKSSKPFESVGYRQALATLSGEMTAAEALAEAQIATRRYAKRQMTWFRKEAGVEWLTGFGSDPLVKQRALEHVFRSVNS